jgi:hypothetical protein
MDNCGDCTQTAFQFAMSSVTSINSKDPQLGYSFFIGSTSGIENLEPCAKISGSLIGAIQMVELNITSLSGLGAITSIANNRYGATSVEIYENQVLTTAEDLTASYTGQLIIRNNPVLCEMPIEWGFADDLGHSLPEFPTYCVSVANSTRARPIVPTEDDGKDGGGGGILGGAVQGNPMALGLLTVLVLMVVALPTFILKAVHLLQEMQASDPYNTKGSRGSTDSASARVSWSHSSSTSKLGEMHLNENNPMQQNPMQNPMAKARMAAREKMEPKVEVPIEEMVLPPGWEPFIDEDSGAYYYHCEATGETTWTHPAQDPDHV